MTDSSKMFGEEKIGKLLFKFSIPIILSMLISELYSMVDTMFVGNYVNENGIGALVLVFPIQRFIIALSMMFALGTSTAFSRANGSEDSNKAKEIVINGFSLTITTMITITTLVYLFKEQILVFLGASDLLLPYALDYLGIIIFGSVFLSSTLFISNIILALGNNKVAIIANSIGAITNIIIDYILVVKVGMGVKGAAYATAFSQFVGFLFAYYNFRKVKKEYNIKTKFTLKPSILIPIVLVGVSAFIVEAEDGIVIAVLNNLLQEAAGDEGIVVLGVITKVYMFLFVNMFGIASAMQPIASYNIGARNYKRVKETVKKAILFAFLTSGILWAGTMIFAKQIISLFVVDKHIIKSSVTAFRIMVSVFPIISVYYVSIFYYQALGKARASVMVSIFRQIIIMIPIALFLVKVMGLGAMGAWLSYPVSDILAAIFSGYLMKKEADAIDEKIKEKKYSKELSFN